MLANNIDVRISVVLALNTQPVEMKEGVLHLESCCSAYVFHNEKCQKHFRISGTFSQLYEPEYYFLVSANILCELAE